MTLSVYFCIVDWWANTNKYEKRIRILYEREKEYELTNRKRNDFERVARGEIISVGNRKWRKGENKIYNVNKIGSV